MRQAAPYLIQHKIHVRLVVVVHGSVVANPQHVGICAGSRHGRLGRRWGYEHDLYPVVALQHGPHGRFVKGAEARHAGLHWTRRLALPRAIVSP